MLQSTALDQNDTTESADDEEDGDDGGVDPAPPDRQEIKVVLGTQPLITATALVRQFQKDYSIFWAPSEMPILVEDDDSQGEFQLTFKSHFNEEVTITFHFFQYMSDNEDFDDTQPESPENQRQIYGFDWLNIEEFRATFANIIMNSEEDIRMTYFIVTAFYGRCDVNSVNYEFSRDNTIDMRFETVKYWRTIPLHLDDSQATDLALYKNDAEQLAASIQERFKLVADLINQLIQKNNNDIANRLFRNKMFQESVQKTHDGILQTIGDANALIQQEAQEAATRLQEYQLALQCAIEENQQNALAVIEEQNGLVAESRDIIQSALDEARAAMEHVTEEVQQQHAEMETRLAEFKEARQQTLIEVQDNTRELAKYRAETLLLAKATENYAKDLKQQIVLFNNEQTPEIADFKLDIPKIVGSSDQIMKINRNAIDTIKTSTSEIGKLTQSLVTQIIEKRKAVAEEDQKKYMMLRETAMNIMQRIQTIKQANIARTDQARLLLAFNTQLINRIKETALVPTKGVDFTPCIKAIEQLTLIANNEKKASAAQESELSSLMKMTQRSIDSFVSALKDTPVIKINQPGVDLIPDPLELARAPELSITDSLKGIANSGGGTEAPSSPEPEADYGALLVNALNIRTSGVELKFPSSESTNKFGEKEGENKKQEYPTKLTPSINLIQSRMMDFSDKQVEKDFMESVRKTIENIDKKENSQETAPKKVHSTNPSTGNDQPEVTTQCVINRIKISGKETGIPKIESTIQDNGNTQDTNGTQKMDQPSKDCKEPTQRQSNNTEESSNSNIWNNSTGNRQSDNTGNGYDNEEEEDGNDSSDKKSSNNEEVEEEEEEETVDKVTQAKGSGETIVSSSSGDNGNRTRHADEHQRITLRSTDSEF